MQETHLKTIRAYRHLKNLNAQAHAIRAAVKVGVFQQLRGGQKTLADLATACEVQPKPLGLLLEVLKRIGLVEQYGDDFALAQVGQVWPEELADLGDRYWDHLEHWLRSDQPVPENPQTPLDLQDFSREHAADAWLTTPAALDVATALQIGSERQGLNILDLYAGAGVFSLVLLHQDPTSQATLVDTPEHLQPARQHAAGLSSQTRLHWLESDPLQADIPSAEFDLVVLARQLHLLDADQLSATLKLAWQALKPGGELVIVDIFPGQPAADLSRSICELELALRTHGRPMLTPQAIEKRLAENSFGDIQFAHLPAPPMLFGMVLSRKQSTAPGI